MIRAATGSGSRSFERRLSGNNADTMGLVLPLVTGVVLAGAGAWIWSALIVHLNVEIGWLAIGIGAVVGIGIGVTNRSLPNGAAALLAAGLSLGSIGLGKYWSVTTMIENAKTEFHIGDMLKMDMEQMLISDMADMMLTQQGDTATMKRVENQVNQHVERGDFTFQVASFYPEQVWTDAEIAWYEIDDDERKQAISEREDAVRMAFEGMEEMAYNASWSEMFSFFDLLWAFLAVSTAFRLGGRNE